VASVIVVCHVAVYLTMGAFRWGTGLELVTHIFSRVICCVTAVLDKSLFVILYCVQRGNLDKFVSDYDLGDVSISASSTLYLTLKTAIILCPFVFHGALI